MGVFKFCPKCKNENVESWYGFYPSEDEKSFCKIHSTIMEIMPLNIDEHRIITKISKDTSFLEAMIKLKQDDIIEYQSRMSQFKNQIQQQEQTEKKEDNTPHCPICNSTNLSKISTVKKATKIGIFGLFGAGDLGKTWKCNNCGSKF